MKNIIILGSGRSGTSMVAGCLAKSGYFMGNNLYPPRNSNPKGFFESADINGVNEDIISLNIPHRPRILPQWIRNKIFRSRPMKCQRWLAEVPLNVDITTSEEINNHISQLVHYSPYCYKDPRFSYTLPVWKPYLQNTLFICVFRNPGATVQSIIKECNDAEYLHTLTINPVKAERIWILMYQHILNNYKKGGEWLFLHFDEVLENSGLEKIEKFTGACVNSIFPEKKLKRSEDTNCFTVDSLICYKELCKLAEYKINSSITTSHS